MLEKDLDWFWNKSSWSYCTNNFYWGGN